METRKMKKTVILFILMVFPLILFSYETEEKNGKKKFGAVALPIVAYTPETSFMFGATGIGYYNRDPKNKNSVQDTIQLSGIYTLKNQFMGMFRTDFYPVNEKVQTTLFLAANKSPEVFFGIGDSNSDKNKEKYLKEDIKFRAFMGLAINKGIYLGPVFDLWKMDLKKKESGGMLENDNIEGSQGIEKLGFGIRLLADRRDGTFYPLSGFLTEIKVLRYGLQDSFVNFSIDHRHYFNVFKEHVLAFQFIYNIGAGAVPFQMMAPLGGEEMLRGYYKGSYLDKCMVAGQVEYRFPIYWRFEATAFFAAGNVAPKPLSFDPERTAFAGGLGLRLMLDRREKIPIRFDVAVNRDGKFSYYLSIMQAF
jgi:hypothetical protein